MRLFFEHFHLHLKCPPDLYFERCTWIFKHIDRIAFVSRWQQYKAGTATDSMALAGAAIICCIAVYYLPPNHDLARTLDLYQFEHALPGSTHANAARLDRADALATGWYKAFFEAPKSSYPNRRIRTLDEIEVHLARYVIARFLNKRFMLNCVS